MMRISLLLVLFLLPACQTSAQVPVDANYVASSRGEVYYWVECDAWRDLSPANRIYFDAAADARAAGYRPSRSRGCTGPEPVSASADGQRYSPETTGVCLIERVVDGDTVHCAGGESIRLLLIDTPEMAQEPFGTASRAALQELLAPGDEVRLEFDVQRRDRYGRLLAHIHTANGLFVNEAMARSGYAVALVYPPNVKHVERIRAAPHEARAAGRGLWAVEAFRCTPREWRAGRCGGE